MTETRTPHTGGRAAGPVTHPAPTAAAAIRETARAAAKVASRAAQIRDAPHLHEPKLVLSRHVRGDSPLDKVASAVNAFCGSMWVFLAITIGIVCWLFAGNFVGFDKTPWPLLLTILNLPQLSIMISLQVSANRAQAASDRRAIADHETLIALHEMSKRQLDILTGQDKVLAILEKFAGRDLPGRQEELLGITRRVLETVQERPARP